MLTWEDDVEVHALRRRGWSISAIARHTGFDRKTVRKYLAGDAEPGVRARPGVRRIGDAPAGRTRLAPMTTPAPPDDWFLPDEDAVLQMRRVRVRRGTTDILGPLDWTVRAGQRWIVMGPNGAGKSTLLQLAAARLHPTAGDVGVLDEVLGAVDVFELRPRIGLSSAQLAAQVPANEIGTA